MLPSGYSDVDSSSSESEVETIEAASSKKRRHSDSSSSDSDDDSDEDKAVKKSNETEEGEVVEEGSGKLLPSFDSIFEAVGEEDLTYKNFVANKARPTLAFDLEREREEARRRAAEQKHIEETQRVTDGDKAVEPPVPPHGKGMAEPRPTFTSMSKKERQNSHRYSSKDRTRMKRFKGQSGEDHAGRSWKPELWMKMRNDFD